MAEITTETASLIKQARQALGLTQERLARTLKVSFPTVNRWENGKTQPDTRARHALAELLRTKKPDLAGLATEIDGGQEPAPDAPPKKGRRRAHATDTALPTDTTTLDTKSMEGMLWKAACSIRGEKDAPKFKDYILPLLFLKRLSDVFEDEVARLAEVYGDVEIATAVLEEDHSLVRFFIPEEARWPVLAGRTQIEWPAGKAPKTIGERLTNAVRAVARANPTLQGVVDIVDFNETRNGEREISDEALSKIIELFSEPRYRLGLKDVESDFLGRAYEYLLRKFAEGQGQSAGEFFTPKEVGWLIAHLVEPQQGEEVYDYACGSAGLLIKCQLRLHEREKMVKRPLKLHGQELTGSSFAIARMNMVLHDMDGEVVRGNTMTNPKFLEGSSLKKFDVIVANPMWNQDNIASEIYESDPYERFLTGYAPDSNADWAWLQHTTASLKPAGRAAVILDAATVSRGSGNQGDHKEKAIRRQFVLNDWVEAVIALPDNLFYNTAAPGVIIVLNRNKPKGRRNKVLLIRAVDDYRRDKPKNVLTPGAIAKITDTFQHFTEIANYSKTVALDELSARDFDLSPSAYVVPVYASQHDAPEVILPRVLTLRDLHTETSERAYSALQDLTIPGTHWPTVTVDDVVIQSQYGLSVKGSPTGRYPILRMNCQERGRVVYRALQYVDIDEETFEQYRVRTGDILFNRTNSFELVGRTAIVASAQPAVFASYLIRLRIDPSVMLPDYFNFYMNLARTQADLKTLATRGVSQSNISASKLMTFSLPLPPLETQLALIPLLEQLRMHAEVARDYGQAVDALFASTAHKLLYRE